MITSCEVMEDNLRELLAAERQGTTSTRKRAMPVSNPALYQKTLISINR